MRFGVVARLALVVGGALGAAGVAGCASSPPMVDKREVVIALIESPQVCSPKFLTCEQRSV